MRGKTSTKRTVPQHQVSQANAEMITALEKSLKKSKTPKKEFKTDSKKESKTKAKESSVCQGLTKENCAQIKECSFRRIGRKTVCGKIPAKRERTHQDPLERMQKKIMKAAYKLGLTGQLKNGTDVEPLLSQLAAQLYKPRSKTGYHMFVSEMMKGQAPGVVSMKTVADKWKEMKEHDRETYNNKAKQENKKTISGTA